MFLRFFISIIVFSLYISNIHAAAASEKDAAIVPVRSSKSNFIGFFTQKLPFPCAMDGMACQPPASIDEQIATYGAPDALMRKVIQGVFYVSPVITESLARDRLNGLYGQMLHLHKTGRIAMEDFYKFGLILGFLQDNPDLTGKRKVYSFFAPIKDWYNSDGWFLPVQEHPALFLQADEGSEAIKFPPVYKNRLPLVIYIPQGHFGFSEIAETYLNIEDKPLSLVGLGLDTFKHAAHGGLIHGASTMYVHDFLHGSQVDNEDFQTCWPLLNSLLKPLVPGRHYSLSREVRRLWFGIFDTLHENDLDLRTIGTALLAKGFSRDSLSTISQKDLGNITLEKLQENALSSVELDIDKFLRGIQPSLYKKHGKSMNIVVQVDMVHGQATFSIIGPMGPYKMFHFGECSIAFTSPIDLGGPYTFTLDTAKQSDYLTEEQKGLYDSIMESLPGALAGLHSAAMLESYYVENISDKRQSLEWVESGVYKAGKKPTWNDVLACQKGMAMTYDAMRAKGLEVWRDDSVSAEIVTILQKALAEIEKDASGTGAAGAGAGAGAAF